MKYKNSSFRLSVVFFKFGGVVVEQALICGAAASCFSFLVVHFLLLTEHFSVLTEHFFVLTEYFFILTEHFFVLTGHFFVLTECFFILTMHFFILTEHFLLLTECFFVLTEHFSILHGVKVDAEGVITGDTVDKGDAATQLYAIGSAELSWGESRGIKKRAMSRTSAIEIKTTKLLWILIG